MYRCLDCGCIFDEPKRWNENHGYYCLGAYLLEPMSGCPECEGGYEEYDESEDDDYDE